MEKKLEAKSELKTTENCDDEKFNRNTQLTEETKYSICLTL